MLSLYVACCRWSIASMLRANKAVLPRTPLNLSSWSVLLAESSPANNSFTKILESTPFCCIEWSKGALAGGLEEFSGPIKQLVASLTLPTKSIASSITLYLLPWCSANLTARMMRLCSNRATAASLSARCWIWTVWQTQTYKIEKLRPN